MRVGEAASRLDVSKSTVYALVAAGRLTCCRVGLGRGGIRISEEHLAAYLMKAETGPMITPAPAPRLKHLRLPS